VPENVKINMENLGFPAIIELIGCVRLDFVICSTMPLFPCHAQPVTKRVSFLMIREFDICVVYDKPPRVEAG
jgi:hypothetical protein